MVSDYIYNSLHTIAECISFLAALTLLLSTLRYGLRNTCEINLNGIVRNTMISLRIIIAQSLRFSCALYDRFYINILGGFLLSFVVYGQVFVFLP